MVWETAMDMFALLRRLRHCRSGNAAVEFATAAPFLLGALVLMVDVGMAVESRMEMDRNVRAGVQATMANINDLATIQTVIADAGAAAAGVTITVNRTCACGETASSCDSWCAGGEPPSVFINIAATRPFSGMMLPPFTLESETHVQLR